MLSSTDLGNPIYERTFSPRFQQERVEEVLQDDSGNDFKCAIEYHYYRYDGSSRIVYYKIKPLQTYHMTDLSLQESVQDVIYTLERSAMFECNPKIIHL